MPTPRRTTATLLTALACAAAGDIAGCGSSNTSALSSSSTPAPTVAAPTLTSTPGTTAADGATTPSTPATTPTPTKSPSTKKSRGGTPTSAPAASSASSSGSVPATACALLTGARAKQVIPDAQHHGAKDPPVICSYASRSTANGRPARTLTLLWTGKKVSATRINQAFDNSTANLTGGATLTHPTGIGEKANLVAAAGAGGTVVWTQRGYLLVLSYLDYTGTGKASTITALTDVARAMSHSL